MRILITGGCGFIGSNFVHFLINKMPGFASFIAVLDSLTYAGNLENLASVIEKIDFVRGDICNEELVDYILKSKQIDTIVHFAAESHVDRSILGPGVFVKTNVLGTQALLECAKRNKIKRFLHVSTDEVFGSLPLNTKEKFNENSPYKPSSPYSASKAASDHLARAYHLTFGQDIVITNCSNNYGPYQFPEKLMPLFITNLIDGKKVPLYGSGQNVRDWLHVEDHCLALALVLEKGKSGETYCIGGNNEHSNLEITDMILRIMGKGEEFIEKVEDRKGHDLRYAIDASKIRDELGFVPQISFEQGLIDTVAWYVKNQDWWRRVKSGEYLKYYQENFGKVL